jgi:hypothetical protein
MSAATSGYTTFSRNSAEKNAANLFNLKAQVESSVIPLRRRVTLAAMLADNRFGTELYSSTLRLAIRLGVSYCTVQRHIDRLVKEDKVLILIRPANQPAALNGGEFRPTATYKLQTENLQPRETVEEWENRTRPHMRRRGRRPTRFEPRSVPRETAQPESRVPDPPLPPPAPARQSAAEPAHHSTVRVTRDERMALFSTYVALKKIGKSHADAIAEVARQFKDRYSAEEIEIAVKIVDVKDFRQSAQQDARDWRRLRREMDLVREARVGTSCSGEQNFADACMKAGISVERGRELWERMMSSPDDSA